MSHHSVFKQKHHVSTVEEIARWVIK